MPEPNILLTIANAWFITLALFLVGMATLLVLIKKPKKSKKS